MEEVRKREWETVVGMWDDGSPCSVGKWHSQRQRQ